MKVENFYDKATNTLTYLVYDPISKDGIIIDPVLDFDAASGAVSTKSLDKILGFIKSNSIKIHYSFETHAHADHISSSYELRKKIPGLKIAISSKIIEVQRVFNDIFDIKSFSPDGSQFDTLIEDRDSISAGTIEVKVMHTPGHTPACVSLLIEDLLFTGDALFMPDFGVGRCDFPLGSAGDLYHSVMNRIYKLDDDIKVYTGHDYQPGGRELKFESSIAEQKEDNIHINKDTPIEEFVRFRTERDAGLNPPKLLFYSIQVNINAGKLPDADKSGRSFLKLPLSL